MTNNHHSAVHSAAGPVIRPTPLSESGETIGWLRILPLWILSALIHAVIVFLFLVVTGVLSFLGSPAEAGASEPVTINTQVEEQPKDFDLTNPDRGIDPTVPLNYDVARIDKVSVPGAVNP